MTLSHLNGGTIHFYSNRFTIVFLIVLKPPDVFYRLAL